MEEYGSTTQDFSGLLRHTIFHRTVKLLDWRKSVLSKMKMVKEYDPFPIGKGSYKSTNGRFFHCFLVVYPLDTGSTFSIHKSGGRFPAKKRTSKNRGFGDPTQAFIRLDTEIVYFREFPKKQKPDLLDLQDSGTSHHQDDMNQSKTHDKNNSQDCSNPPIRAFVILSSRMAGTPKFGWRLLRLLSRKFFFEDVFFRKG